MFLIFNFVVSLLNLTEAERGMTACLLDIS